MFGLDNLNKTLQRQKWRLSKGIATSIFIAIVAVMLGLNVQYLISRFKRDQPIGYITKKVSRDEYIQLYRPDYAAVQYANRHLTADSKILGLYMGGRGYYSDIDISFDLKILPEICCKFNISDRHIKKIEK